MRALILDPAPLLALQLRYLLEELGWRATVADDLDACDLDAFDLDGSDLDGSDLDGLCHGQDGAAADLVFIELVQAQGNGFRVLRRLAECGRVPVVLVSGTGRDTDRIWGRRAGAADVLRRPLTIDSLRRTLKHLHLPAKGEQ